MKTYKVYLKGGEVVYIKGTRVDLEIDDKISIYNDDNEKVAILFDVVAIIEDDSIVKKSIKSSSPAFI